LADETYDDPFSQPKGESDSNSLIRKIEKVLHLLDQVSLKSMQF